MNSYLAVDIGAESGRCIFGILENNLLIAKQVHRFSNQIVNLNGHLHWDINNLFYEIKKGIEKSISSDKKKNLSIAIDSWGVDFGLLDHDGKLIELPWSYRDNRTNNIIGKFSDLIPKTELYELTGTQFMQINTLFQLYSMKLSGSEALEKTKDLLFIPDLLNYFFTGKKLTEYTIATTSQLYNITNNKWEDFIFEKAGVSDKIMQPIIKPATVIGNIKTGLFSDTSAGQIKVIAPGSHDTASAVAAIPATDDNFAFISSGTWSLMGIETEKPVINELTFRMNFTNEGGVCDTIRLLKNIMGLWLLQQCYRSWSGKYSFTYNELAELSLQAQPFKCLIDPDDNSFLTSKAMTEDIINFCKKTKQPLPENIPEFCRCIFESLALKYRFVLEQIKLLKIKPVERIYITGGGSKNKILCQYIANSTGLPVIAGPAEATAVGNILIQALAGGQLSSLKEIREVVVNSFETVYYEPKDLNIWEEKYQEFKSNILQEL